MYDMYPDPEAWPNLLDDPQEYRLKPEQEVHAPLVSAAGQQGLLDVLNALLGRPRPLGHPVTVTPLCGSQKGATTNDHTTITCTACKDAMEAL